MSWGGRLLDSTVGSAERKSVSLELVPLAREQPSDGAAPAIPGNVSAANAAITPQGQYSLWSRFRDSPALSFFSANWDLSLCYFISGLMLCYPSTPMFYFLNNEMGLAETPGKIDAYWSAVFSVCSLKFVWAACADNIPLWSLRRKPYLVIGAAVASSMLSMSALYATSLAQLYVMSIVVAIGQQWVSTALDGVLMDRVAAANSQGAKDSVCLSVASSDAQTVVRSVFQLSSPVATIMATALLAAFPERVRGVLAFGAIMPAALALIAALLLRDTPLTSTSTLFTRPTSFCGKLRGCCLRLSLRRHQVAVQMRECCSYLFDILHHRASEPLIVAYIFCRGLVPGTANAEESWFSTKLDMYPAWSLSAVKLLYPVAEQLAIFVYWIGFRNSSQRSALVYTTLLSSGCAFVKLSLIKQWYHCLKLGDSVFFLFERLVSSFERHLALMPLIVLITTMAVSPSESSCTPLSAPRDLTSSSFGSATTHRRSPNVPPPSHRPPSSFKAPRDSSVNSSMSSASSFIRSMTLPRFSPTDRAPSPTSGSSLGYSATTATHSQRSTLSSLFSVSLPSPSVRYMLDPHEFSNPIMPTAVPPPARRHTASCVARGSSPLQPRRSHPNVQSMHPAVDEELSVRLRESIEWPLILPATQHSPSAGAHHTSYHATATASASDYLHCADDENDNDDDRTDQCDVVVIVNGMRCGGTGRLDRSVRLSSAAIPSSLPGRPPLPHGGCQPPPPPPAPPAPPPLTHPPPSGGAFTFAILFSVSNFGETLSGWIAAGLKSFLNVTPADEWQTLPRLIVFCSVIRLLPLFILFCVKLP